MPQKVRPKLYQKAKTLATDILTTLKLFFSATNDVINNTDFDSVINRLDIRIDKIEDEVKEAITERKSNFVWTTSTMITLFNVQIIFYALNIWQMYIS